MLQASGFYVATVAPPAVSAKDVGLRLTITTHHKAEDIDDLLRALDAAISASNQAVAE